MIEKWMKMQTLGDKNWPPEMPENLHPEPRKIRNSSLYRQHTVVQDNCYVCIIHKGNNFQLSCITVLVMIPETTSGSINRNVRYPGQPDLHSGTLVPYMDTDYNFRCSIQPNELLKSPKISKDKRNVKKIEQMLKSLNESEWMLKYVKES